jgi:hypothetical protein
MDVGSRQGKTHDAAYHADAKTGYRKAGASIEKFLTPAGIGRENTKAS